MSKQKDFRYFDFFEDMMVSCTASVEYLHTVLFGYRYEDLKTYKEEMHKLEHAADIKKHEMMRALMKEFLPPFDREDIVKISHLLDEICDCSEEVILQMYMGDVHTCRPDAAQFSDIVLHQCRELTELFKKFRNYKKDRTIESHIVLVNTVEEEGDRLYADAVHRLHTDGSPFSEIFLWRGIYSCLESCFDACEKIADAVEEVLMKNT